jgi:hypothetical protein
MNKTVAAQFRTKHADVYYGPVEIQQGDDSYPRYATLEQYAGTFEYNHDGDMPVYQEVES